MTPPSRTRLVLETLWLLIGLGVVAMLAVHGFGLLLVGMGELARKMAEAAGW